MEAIDLELTKRLALALAIGVLIGAERGWHGRELEEGRRVIGLRTLALVGLSGGVWASLAELLGELLLGVAFLGIAGVLLATRLRAVADRPDYGATTLVAALLTFALGALAVRGDMALAAAGAVITALLLGIKPIVHHWLTRITYDELLAVLKLLVMSVVLLPVLPDRGFGPWSALNPYELWLMVVLIAGISFVGYAAVRIAGPRAGIPLAAFAGGLLSSTAVTVSYARLARHNPERGALLAGGIALAATTMFPRTLAVAVAIDAALWPLLGPPLLAAGLVGYLAAAVLLWRAPKSEPAGEFRLSNPFELGPALKFGALLTGIMLLTRAATEWLGDAGVYLLALVSGLADVDAINLSLSRMAGESLALELAAAGILLAAVSNTAVKAALAGLGGGVRLLLPVGFAFGAALGAGAVAHILLL